MFNLLLVLSWIIFYTIRMVLAQDKLKRILKAKWPKIYKNYRQLYFLLHFGLLIWIGALALFTPKIQVIPIGGFVSHLGYLIATVGIVVFTRAIKGSSYAQFFWKTEVSNESPSIQGIFLKIRHPFYLGSGLVLLGYFLVAGTLASAIHFGTLALYLPVGIYWEERQLEKIFGEAFRKYKSQVPALFPRVGN